MGDLEGEKVLFLSRRHCVVRVLVNCQIKQMKWLEQYGRLDLKARSFCKCDPKKVIVVT